MIADKRVGLWCADNIIRFTDGTQLCDIVTPHSLLASIMTNGRLTVYMTDPHTLDPFIAYVVHSLPHSTHYANMSWDSIVSNKGKFFSFTVTLSKRNSVRFFDISNLLRENCRATMTDDQLFDILCEYDRQRLCRITAGAASMEAFVSGDWTWYANKFPQCDPEVKTSLHDAYIGGFMLAREGAYGKTIDVDCNSMYPSILRDEWLPYGEPEAYEGRYEQDDAMPLHCDE